MELECEQLDAYLAGDLPSDRLLSFEHHLLTCESCPDAIRQQRWVDELLQSPVRLQLEPPPVHLTSLRECAIVQRTRRIQLAACGLAATILLAVGLITFTIRDNKQAGTSNSIENAPEIVAPDTSNPKSPSAVFVSDENAIAIPLKSTASDVTVVELYPTLETERRWQRELVLQYTLSKSNGG